jgi:hypothetical protein
MERGRELVVTPDSVVSDFSQTSMVQLAVDL